MERIRRKERRKENRWQWGKQEEGKERFRQSGWVWELWICPFFPTCFSVSQLPEQLVLALKQNWTGSLVDAQNCLTTRSRNKKHHTFWKSGTLGLFLSQVFLLKPRCLSRFSWCREDPCKQMSWGTGGRSLCAWGCRSGAGPPHTSYRWAPPGFGWCPPSPVNPNWPAEPQEKYITVFNFMNDSCLNPELLIFNWWILLK